MAAFFAAGGAGGDFLAAFFAEFFVGVAFVAADGEKAVFSAEPSLRVTVPEDTSASLSSGNAASSSGGV